MTEGQNRTAHVKFYLEPAMRAWLLRKAIERGTLPVSVSMAAYDIIRAAYVLEVGQIEPVVESCFERVEARQA